MVRFHDNIRSKRIHFELVDSDDIDNSDGGAMTKEEFEGDERCRRDCLNCFHSSGSTVIEVSGDIDVTPTLQVSELHSSRIARHRQRHELVARCGYMEPNCMMKREIGWAAAPCQATAELRMNSFRRSKNLSASVFRAVGESFYE
jgi:hypothetical protein